MSAGRGLGAALAKPEGAGAGVIFGACSVGFAMGKAVAGKALARAVRNRERAVEDIGKREVDRSGRAWCLCSALSGRPRAGA